MLKISFSDKIKQCVFNFILIFFFSYAINGFVSAFGSQTYYTNFGTVTTTKFSLNSVSIVIIIATYIYELILNHLKLKISSCSLLYPLTLSHKGRKIKVEAFLDTGNMLNHKGRPIIVLDLETYLKLSNQNLINFHMQACEHISTKTVTGTNNLKLFQVDKIEIKNKNKKITLENQYIAINSTNCFSNTSYKALISPMLL